MLKLLFPAMALTLTASSLGAAGPVWPSNDDESKVPPYVLPEVLKTADGGAVKSAGDWRWKRRPELVAQFESGMFGQAPPRPPLVFEVLEEATPALAGKALRKQVRVFLTGRKEGLAMEVLLYIPAGATGPVPFFEGLNFAGNHTVSADPGIRLAAPLQQPATGRDPRPFKDLSRGSQATRWSVEQALARGYGVATACYEDIDPDFDDGFKLGVHALYPDLETRRDGRTWGSLAAWAWGLRVMMDYLEAEPWCDARRVAVHGHSRLGKAALWAGALDERFSVVISNNSGCGGAALSKRWFGETVGRINSSFPYWFCSNFHQWNGREAEMPFDQHELLALVAPRGLLVGSAEEDHWADPEGELIAAREASPVFQLLGEAGLAPGWRRVNLAIASGNPVHWQRPGKHDVQEADWIRWMDFAKTRWGK